MKRRDFLKTSALAAAATTTLSSFTFPESKKIGLQLYSLRDVINKDVKGVLKQVADFGYKELETYGYNDGNLFGMKSKEFSEIVKGLGMRITSGHYGTGRLNPDTKGTLSNDWDRAAADAKEAGQGYMIVAYLQEKERQSLDDYKKVIEMINKAAEISKKHGVKIGYHNHSFEFDKIDGQVPYDLMLKELDPKLVSMELDLYWIINAGYDPIEYFNKYPGRFEQWHVKDMSKADKTKNTEVGTGTIDFKKIFAKASVSGMKHFYIEFDTFPGSPVDAVGKSYKNLTAIL